jgi:tRNA(fMet)-specific endonuclease VapC
LNFLFDTNVVIALINNRQPAVRSRMERAKADGDAITLSSISLQELWFGIAKSDRPGASIEALRRVLATGIEILSFDGDDAEAVGNLRGHLTAIGKPIGPYDFLIAGQAVRRNATLITANEKEFARVPGLKWENWAK